MDCVYICRGGENEELRYSIRSVEANLPHANIWVVGSKPAWYSGKHIRVSQNLSKYRNAIANLEAIVSSKSISDDFILMNDDFFIIEPVESVQSFYRGYLLDSIEERKDLDIRTQYIDMMENTYHRLVKNGIMDPLDYELHIPMVMNKSKLAKVIKFGFLWRSMYGNLNNVGGIQMDDVKVQNPDSQESKRSHDYKNHGTVYLSSNDGSFEEIRSELLNGKFPKPSSLELA